MDRLAIIVVLLIAFIILHMRNLKRKSEEEKCEGVIAFYIFSCCFTKLYLPLITVDEEQHYGSFGQSLVIWPYLLFCIYLLWTIKRKYGGLLSKPKKQLVACFLIFAGFNLANPNNAMVSSTMLAVFFLATLFLFLFLLGNAFSLKTLVRGIYKGLALTICLQAVLCIMFPILGMKFITKVFVEGAGLRGEVGGRFETVGTFAHPNGLGVYGSYVFMFFLGCVMANFQRRKSAVLLAVCVFVTGLSGSRSALASAMVGAVALSIFYVLRRYSLLNPKVLLRGVLPVLIVGVVLAMGPLKQLFADADNLEEMATYRLMHYYCAGEIVGDHPLIGVGLNCHLHYLLHNTSLVDFEAIFDTSEMWEPEEFMFRNPVHNIWLILLAEMGIIGFLPILGFVIYYFATFKRRIRKAQNRYYHIVACTGLGIMCALLVQGNSDWNPLSQQQLIISLMFLCFSLNRRFMSDQYGDEMDILQQPATPNEDDADSLPPA
ncbi:MAG: O-antigen ligase family protein [Bacteroidales bacterium]|nr:O-antigen ligase family protein [Bacteroidales bacterium]